MIILLFNPEGAPQTSAGGKTVYAPKELMTQTSAVLSDIGTLKENKLLHEIHSEMTLGWKLGAASDGETLKDVKQRAVAAAKEQILANESCILAVPPKFLRYLIRAFEKNGCNALRRENGAIRAGERIRITLKKDHCGGCQHNCLLSNPGCGVGRDKASRGY